MYTALTWDWGLGVHCYQ